MEGFYAAYAAWSNALFPAGSERDDLADLRGDLAVADEWILSTVYPFAEHGEFHPARIDITAGLATLRYRLEAARASVSGDDAALADSYLNYLALLEALYTEFRRVTAARE